MCGEMSWAPLLQPGMVTSYTTCQWSAKHTTAMGVTSKCFGARMSGHSYCHNLLVLSHIQPDIVTSYMQWSAKHTTAMGVTSECDNKINACSMKREQ